MAEELFIPQLGQTVESVTIINWHVKDGDRVEQGQEVLEVETDKATLEMESPSDGFVKHIIATAGQTLPVGDAVMVLGEKDVDVPQSFVDSLSSSAPVAAATTAPAAAAIGANSRLIFFGMENNAISTSPKESAVSSSTL